MSSARIVFAGHLPAVEEKPPQRHREQRHEDLGPFTAALVQSPVQACRGVEPRNFSAGSHRDCRRVRR